MAYGTVMHALALKCLTSFAHVCLSQAEFVGVKQG